MTVCAAVLAALAAAVACGRPAGGVQRLRGASEPAGRTRPQLSAPSASALAGVGIAVLVGLPAGLFVGLVVAVAGPALLSRLEPAAVRRGREQLTADLPLALDLLAACLAGGAALPAAADAVAGAVRGPCGVRLERVTAALAVGSSPGEAWSALAGGQPDDPLAPAARVLARAAEGGTPAASAAARLAAEARAVSQAAGSEAARRLGVVVVVPLGLCFLPAFVLLGIVPAVAGLAGPLLATF